MADKIVSQDPTKPGVNKVNGPTLTALNEVPLSGLDSSVGNNGDVIAKSAGVWGPSAAPPSADTASNLGAGSQSFKSKVGADFQFRSIIGAGSVTGVQNANDITLTGAVITGSNLGAGNGVFSAKVANDLQFKSLVAGANVTLTPTANDITIALAGSSSPFSDSFTSSNQVITAGGSLTLAHGLGGMPTLVQARLICTSASQGYSANDEVILWLGPTQSADSAGVSVLPDATNLNVRYGAAPTVFYIFNKGTGNTEATTIANWQVIFRAWI